MVAKPFIGNGHRYERGEVLNWKEKGMLERRVKQLFYARRVVHPSSDQLRKLVADKTITAEEATDNSPTSILEKDPEFYLKKLHGGWYNIVDKDGVEQLERNARLDQASDLLEEFNRGDQFGE